MKKTMIIFCIAVLFAGQVQAADKAIDTEKLTKNSRAVIKELASELKATLQTSMKANGPVESIAVCQQEAPKIAAKISSDSGITVARTSLKYRNPGNSPDSWEKSVLEQFEQREKTGEPVDAMEFSEVTEVNGKQLFRYMKAIPTDDVCVKCHGTEIAPPLAAKINQLYPEDKATGFNKGDIRGAFTVTQPIDQ